MKKNTLSKCSLAISIALGLFTSSAFAVNNDINPLTGAPANPVVSSTPATGNAIQLNSSSPTTPSGLVDEDSQDSVKKEESSSSEDKEDYSYQNEEKNLKKASNLKVQLTILDLENQIKAKKDELKGIKPDNNPQNSANNGINQNGMNYQQNQPIQQAAPQPVYETVETKTPAIKATATYGLGKDLFAEIYVGDNKYVMGVGSTLPNGYKLVSVNDFGVVLKKGSTKMQLPVVPVPKEGANINVTTQKRLVSQASDANGSQTMAPPIMTPAVMNTPSTPPMSMPVNNQNNVVNSPPAGLGGTRVVR